MNLNLYKQKMQKSVEVVSEEIGRLRTGRATPSLVENVEVQAYGGAQTLRVLELASIHAEDNQTLVVKPWDQSVIGEISKAVNAADLGLNSVIDGEVIRIKIPALTEERRQEYVKLLHTKLEAGRVAIRQVRQEAMQDVRKAEEGGDINEDDKKRLEDETQKMTDAHIKEIDDMGRTKEEELMKV